MSSSAIRRARRAHLSNRGIVVFDTNGQMHRCCPAWHPLAQAFGPAGVSRPCEPAEVGLALLDGETPLAAARRVGRLIERDDDDPCSWNLLQE